MKAPVEEEAIRSQFPANFPLFRPIAPDYLVGPQTIVLCICSVLLGTEGTPSHLAMVSTVYHARPSASVSR